MPSKLKKAIAAVKDQTSISLAKVGAAESSSLEVAILKATTHEEIPMDERHVTEVLQLVSSNRSYAGSCARAIGRRIGRTKSWVVAIKSLMMVLRIFQDGDPHFPKEVLHSMKRGYKILNLSSFRDDSSTTCPWDFTAFVRTFALYLDERLDCFLTGKLQRRTSYHQSGPNRGYARRRHEPVVRDMKPAMLLDRISHWQRLLDRAIATRPTGAAKTNRLVQTCIYAIVQETFDLYRDISDGLALLLDSFFHLQYNNCVNAYQTCVKASKQFEELCAFYDLCKSIGVGRTSEYPSIQKVSEELVETLQEFLKDQSSFPATNGRTLGNHLPLPAPVSPNNEYDTTSVRQSERTMSEFGGSQFDGSQCTSLEDLISADASFSPERYSDPGGEKPSSQMEEYYSANDTASVRSDPTDHRGVNSMLDLLSLDDPSPSPELQGQGQEQGQGQGQEQSFEFNNNDEPSSSSGQGWELVLFETTSQPSTQPSNHNHDNVANNTNGFEVDLFSNINANASASANVASPSSSWLSTEHTYNPFLQDTNGGGDDLFGGFGQTSVATGANDLDLGLNTVNSMGGFPTDLGINSATRVTPTFQADFGNGDGNFPADFPTGLGNGNSHTSGDFSDLFSDLGGGNSHGSFDANGAPTLNGADFGSGNLSVSPSFSANSHGSFDANNANAPTLNHAGFGNGKLSVSPSFSANSHGSFDANVNAPTLDGAGFGNGKLSVSPSFSANSHGSFDANANAPTLNNGKLSVSPSFSANSHGSFDANVNAPTLDRAEFGSGKLSISPSFSAGGTGSANAMNAIVPFGQTSNDVDLFASTTPTFQSTPTFRATSLDMDKLSSFNMENDPFGPLPVADEQQIKGSLDQQSILQQQQLWLQNQNKIMAKHLT